MPYAFYVAVKLVSYILWCWLGLRLWRPGSASLRRAAAFGTLRLAIGVVFGVSIYLASLFFPAQSEYAVWKYIAIYAPVRMVEWFILLLIIGRGSDSQSPLLAISWCLGGIVVSFVADLASPEGVAGHFCVGRCLC